MGAKGLGRVRESLETAPGSKTFKSKGPGNAQAGGGTGRERPHAGIYVQDPTYDRMEHDLGPWMETPQSSRVSRFRYDYQNEALQVQWRNNHNHGYIDYPCPYETCRSFARVASKGRYVNSTLNGLPDYRLMTDEEVHAPSNTSRQQIRSRTRG